MRSRVKDLVHCACASGRDQSEREGVVCGEGGRRKGERAERGEDLFHSECGARRNPVAELFHHVRPGVGLREGFRVQG